MRNPNIANPQQELLRSTIAFAVHTYGAWDNSKGNIIEPPNTNRVQKVVFMCINRILVDLYPQALFTASQACHRRLRFRNAIRVFEQ